MLQFKTDKIGIFRPPGRRMIRSAALLLAVLTAMTAFITLSCVKEPERQQTTTTKPVVIEDTYDALYQILSQENKNTSAFGLKQIRDFYSAGTPFAILTKSLTSPNALDLNLKASVDRSVFDEDAEQADFIVNLLKDASVSIKCAADPKKKNGAVNVEVILSGQRLAGAELLTEGGERFAVRSPELYPNYLAMEVDDFMKIISDAAHSNAFRQLTQKNALTVNDRYLKIIGLLEIGQERSKSILKPFIEKSRGAITKDNVVIEHDAEIEGIPDKKFKKVSVSLVSDDLHRMLTAMVQAAKENRELTALVKEKYAAVYDYLAELAEIGLDPGLSFDGMPPAENIDGMFQSTFAAFEMMLDSASELPIKAISLDLYVDGFVLNCINFKVWMNETPETAAGSQSDSKTKESQSDSKAKESQSDAGDGDGAFAGEPALSVWINAYELQGGRRVDSFTASFGEAGGATSGVSLNSELIAGKNGGTNVIILSLDGPAFYGGISSVSLNYEWDRKRKSLKLTTALSDDNGEKFDVTGIKGEMTESDGGNDYEFTAELNFNDPKAPTSSGYAASIWCDGRLSFKQAEIPAIDYEDSKFINQDSFYDGTFENIFNEFYSNVVRFASANRQLLGLYGFPGF